MGLRNRKYFVESENPIQKNIFGMEDGNAFMIFSDREDARDAAAKINDYTKTMNASYSNLGGRWKLVVDGMKASELVRLIAKLGIKPSRTYH